MSRLIDADALMKTLGITDTDCGKCDLHGAMGCSKKGRFVDACMAIENAPTIEERKKGEWENAGEYPWDKCSVCGHCVNPYEDDYIFCPNCGADMRGENDGE